MSVSNAYQATEEDVANVLNSNALANPGGKSIEQLAAEVFPGLDFGLIEEAALYGDDLESQTDYANDEITRQLVEKGVLLPSVNPLLDVPQGC